LAFRHPEALLAQISFNHSGGIASIEDKIVQQAVVTVLSAIYEEDFIGFSYGFRPGGGQHDALDALTAGIKSRSVNWIVDADIRSFLARRSGHFYLALTGIVRFRNGTVAKSGDVRPYRAAKKAMSARLVGRKRARPVHLSR
jgi:hypothetical protein